MHYRTSYTMMLPHISGGDKTPDLEQIFPAFYHWATLGQEHKQKVSKAEEEDLAQKAAKAMMMMGRTPAHIQALLNEDSEPQN